MKEKDREVTDKWRKAFKDIYGFQLASLEDRLLTAPDKVLEVFNMYGNCQIDQFEQGNIPEAASLQSTIPEALKIKSKRFMQSLTPPLPRCPLENQYKTCHQQVLHS
ncbi:hypothetical protein BDV30DRAFT_234615 [Aspergillus minisclerotigenes]|uniref:Uncharacterized protein n=1 Tax=Aspergillus minisclerotigenes TaxID=656917 RepID=A0A5N6JHG6_9EURO|nr:hypothetical protein BDV30DRAFT_234615 [Aspergillus minisclerotigenes]